MLSNWYKDIVGLLVIGKHLLYTATEERQMQMLYSDTFQYSSEARLLFESISALF